MTGVVIPCFVLKTLGRPRKFPEKEISKHEHQADDMEDQDTISLLQGPEAKELNENSNTMTVIFVTILYKRDYTIITEYCPSANIR